MGKNVDAYGEEWRCIVQLLVKNILCRSSVSYYIMQEMQDLKHASIVGNRVNIEKDIQRKDTA